MYAAYNAVAAVATVWCRSDLPKGTWSVVALDAGQPTLVWHLCLISAPRALCLGMCVQACHCRIVLSGVKVLKSLRVELSPTSHTDSSISDGSPAFLLPAKDR